MKYNFTATQAQGERKDKKMFPFSLVVLWAFDFLVTLSLCEKKLPSILVLVLASRLIYVKKEFMQERV